MSGSILQERGRPGTSGDPAEYALSKFGLVGQTCLITGGTVGIGKAVVQDFCALGAQVLLCARREDQVDAFVAELLARGFKVQGCAADVSDRSQCKALVQKVSEAFGGKLDILVNNVGTNIRKPTVETTADDYSSIMGTNLESSYVLCQLCHPLLKAAGKGIIIFNSSVAGGPLSMCSGSVYAMTKAAINQLTRNLSVEWAKDNIRVNAVCPWYTATPLAVQVLQDKEYNDKVLARTPMGRIAETAEVASAIAFLASPAASYVTGQCLSVDGGYSAMGMW